jgi:hypothetical protein
MVSQTQVSWRDMRCSVPHPEHRKVLENPPTAARVRLSVSTPISTSRPVIGHVAIKVPMGHPPNCLHPARRNCNDKIAGSQPTSGCCCGQRRRNAVHLAPYERRANICVTWGTSSPAAIRSEGWRKHLVGAQALSTRSPRLWRANEQPGAPWAATAGPCKPRGHRRIVRAPALRKRYAGICHLLPPESQ